MLNPALSLDLAGDDRQEAICQIHEATAIYTAEPVVRALVERTGWPHCDGRFLDPSAGDGVFLLEALRRLAPQPEDWDAADRVRGYEIHPGAVAQARERVAGLLVELSWPAAAARVAARRIVVERDFLVGEVDGSYASVGSNPPYLRFARVPDYFKNLYRDLIKSYALGDLAHAFLSRLSEVVPPGGRIVAVTADRWLQNETAAELRAVLGTRMTMAHLARLDETSCFYRAKTRRRAGALPRVHPVEMLLLVGDQRGKAITAEPICPSGVEVDPNALTLGEIANVRITPWLGPAGVFVVTNEVAATLPEGDWVPVVDTDDIDPHTDALGAPKRMGLRSRRDQEPTGALHAHLLAGQARLPERATRGPYWMPPENITADLSEPSLLIPRIARRLRCVDLPPGISGINHNLSVIRTGVASLDEIKAVMLAPESQEWLERTAPRLESGFYSVTTRMLRRLPVPERLAGDLRQRLALVAA